MPDINRIGKIRTANSDLLTLECGDCRSAKIFDIAIRLVLIWRLPRRRRPQAGFCRVLIVLLWAFAYWPHSLHAQSEISLFDSRGAATAYISETQGRVIFLWDGQPVAYLDSDDVYGFNGKHLGWWANGAVHDHVGAVACVIKSRYGGSTSYEPYKGYRSYQPYRAYKEYAPNRPSWSNQFSTTPCERLLETGQ